MTIAAGAGERGAGVELDPLAAAQQAHYGSTGKLEGSVRQAKAKWAAQALLQGK